MIHAASPPRSAIRKRLRATRHFLCIAHPARKKSRVAHTQISSLNHPGVGLPARPAAVDVSAPSRHIRVDANQSRAPAEQLLRKAFPNRRPATYRVYPRRVISTPTRARRVEDPTLAIGLLKTIPAHEGSPHQTHPLAPRRAQSICQ